MSTATDLDLIREANLRLWTQHTASLEALDLTACAELWSEGGRMAVAYPIPGMPPEVVGREAIAAVLGGFAAAVYSLEQRDVSFHQTTDPAVAFVQFSWHAQLKDGSTYDNDYVARVTIRDGRFSEVVEYYGERAHADLVARVAGGGNHAVWQRQAQAFYAGRIEESMSHWHEDARWETATPMEGMPAVIEGRTALTQLFAGFAEMAESIEARDFAWRPTDDPDVVYIEERLVAALRGGGVLDQRVMMRVTFRDGKIASMLEFTARLLADEIR